MKVLFLGASGVVGSQVVPVLMESFDLTLAARGVSEVAGSPVSDVDILDLEELESFIKAGDANGEPFDVVVNCAIASYKGVNRREQESHHRYAEDCIEVNARGAYHVFEAAARANVPRVIYISSLTAVSGLPHYNSIDENSHDRPRDIYAACKLFGENVGRYYAFRPEQEGARLRVICLRLGLPYRAFSPSDESWTQRPDRGIGVHAEDIAQAIHLSLIHDANFEVYTIVSHSDAPFVDPKLYAELGYKPVWNFTSEGIFRLTDANNHAVLASQHAIVEAA
jgi:nucleoside-diphosphate-sugar epimerase